MKKEARDFILIWRQILLFACVCETADARIRLS